MPVAATVTIRVTPETRERLNRISAARGISAGELVDELASDAEAEAATDYPSRSASSAFCTCRRFSASSHTAERSP